MTRNQPIRTGHRDARPDTPAHVKGVKEGNSGGEQPGHLPDGRSTAERSTGVNPGKRDPIDPDMPNLSPA